MRDFPLCDLLLLPANEKKPWKTSLPDLISRRILGDLGRVLPLLYGLEYSQLDYWHVCSSQGLLLKLVLQPRQRNLLVSPKRANTFEIEAAQVQSEIFNLEPTLRKLARVIKLIPPQARDREADLLLEMMVRRSRKRWQLTQEGAQMELIFPDSPSELVDDEVHCIEGRVRMLSEGGLKFILKVTLVDAEVCSSDAEATRISGLDKIVVYVPSAIERSPDSTPWVDTGGYQSGMLIADLTHRNLTETSTCSASTARPSS